MSIAVLGTIEILAFFGGVLAFCWYQLYSLRKLREAEAQERERAEKGLPPDPAKAGKKDRGDIFWDTLAKKR
ncbi:MAG: hypothetical protein AAFS07_02875 [Pseudomonadota bacterium]